MGLSAPALPSTPGVAQRQGGGLLPPGPPGAEGCHSSPLVARGCEDTGEAEAQTLWHGPARQRWPSVPLPRSRVARRDDSAGAQCSEGSPRCRAAGSARVTWELPPLGIPSPQGACPRERWPWANHVHAQGLSFPLCTTRGIQGVAPSRLGPEPPECPLCPPGLAEPQPQPCCLRVQALEPMAGVGRAATVGW